MNTRLPQKRSLGQVFLNTEWPVQRMATRLKDLGVTRVLEIGPGAGILTRALLDVGLDVTAVEKDERFATRLTEFASLKAAMAEARPEAPSGHLTVVDADILRFDLPAWVDAIPGVAAVCGNIPYNISSPILLLTLPVLGRLAGLLVMTQLEFAARLSAKPHTKDFGSLTVFTQLRAEVSLEFKVGRECFQPVPKVDSAVVLLTPRRDPRLDVERLSRVERVTRQAFTQRRKQLRNSIRPFLETKGGADCPFDLERRADALSPMEFVELTNWLFS